MANINEIRIEHPVEPPAWGTMHAIDPKAVTNALAGLDLARSVMVTTKATLACMHVTLTPGRTPKHRVSLWKRAENGGYQIIDAGPHLGRPILDELCGWMVGAARDIAARWPEKARPTVIGLGTDGHKIVFNPGQPSCEGPAWLEEHLNGRSPATIVADDGQPGFLTIITENEGMH